MDELNLHHKHNETDTQRAQERLKKEGNNQVTGRLRMCFCVACQSGTWMDQWLIPGCKHAKWCGELCGKNTTRGDLIQWYSKLMIIIGPVCCSSLPAAFWNLPIPLATTCWNLSRCFWSWNNGQDSVVASRSRRTALSWRAHLSSSSMNSNKWERLSIASSNQNLHRTNLWIMDFDSYDYPMSGNLTLGGVVTVIESSIWVPNMKI